MFERVYVIRLTVGNSSSLIRKMTGWVVWVGVFVDLSEFSTSRINEFGYNYNGNQPEKKFILSS